MLLYIGLILTLFIFNELIIYVYHRVISHTDMVGNLLHETHKLHHDDVIDEPEHLSQDFVAVFVLYLIASGLLLTIVNNSDLKLTTALFMILIFGILIFLDYYHHVVIHSPNHWLMKYDYFKNARALHLEHHKSPNVNYSFGLTHIPDKLFGTYKEPEQVCNVYKPKLSMLYN